MTRRLLVLAATLAALLGTVSCSVGDDGTTVTARLRDAAGLFEGNDVGVLGVRVGEVVSVTPRGTHVDVLLRIDPGVDVPADAGAVVVSRSVATDRYVELTPVHTAGPTLRDGAVIGLGRTRTPVEFDELLETLTDVSASLGEEGEATGSLGRLLTASAENLDGNGAAIRDGIGDLATVLEAVEGGLGDVEGTVGDLDVLTTALADEDALVRRFTGEVADATQMLDEQKESLEATFAALAAMVREVAAFVRDHRDELEGQLDDFVALADDLNAHREDYQQLLDTGPLMLQNLTRAIDEDGRLAFRTRPLDLVPGAVAVEQVCARLPADVCGRLGVTDASLFDLLRTLAGVRDQ